ncbi:hypothetical protein EDB85DRAFT_2215768, partial [Lactarius pseudohatsudake]
HRPSLKNTTLATVFLLGVFFFPLPFCSFFQEVLGRSLTCRCCMPTSATPEGRPQPIRGNPSHQRAYDAIASAPLPNICRSDCDELGFGRASLIFFTHLGHLLITLKSRKSPLPLPLHAQPRPLEAQARAQVQNKLNKSCSSQIKERTWLSPSTGEWRELTRGLPPEGHAHTHVLLRPPDGNNHPLWTAATDCEWDDKNRKILSRPLYKRRSTSTAFQLAVDHAFTGSYAARFRPNDPPNSVTCPCGWGLRDPPHLIPSCPRFFNNRIDSGVSGQYWPLTYSQLFTTSKGTKRLMDYLQSSRAGSQPEFGPLPPPPEPD